MNYYEYLEKKAKNGDHEKVAGKLIPLLVYVTNKHLEQFVSEADKDFPLYLLGTAEVTMFMAASFFSRYIVAAMVGDAMLKNSKNLVIDPEFVTGVTNDQIKVFMDEFQDLVQTGVNKEINAVQKIMSQQDE